jgi:phospholipid-translocating ATPase
MFKTWGRSLNWWLCLILIVSSILVFEFGVASLRSAFFPTPEDIFQALEKDPDVKRRFEEAAADELQMGWDRKTNKERDDEEKIRKVVKDAEAREEERREEAVREMLKNRMGSERDGGDRREERGTVGEAMPEGDVDRILSKGYGRVRDD